MTVRKENAQGKTTTRVGVISRPPQPRTVSVGAIPGYPAHACGAPTDGIAEAFCAGFHWARQNPFTNCEPALAAWSAENAERVRRVQEWLGDEREAGRCALELKDAWISRLLEAANGKA